MAYNRLEDQFENQTEAAREQVNAWVARFVPLVMGADPLDRKTTEDRLALTERLRDEAPEVALASARLDAVADHDLLSTFRQARSQLPAIEQDLRRRLGRLAPGNPDSLADLDALQARLAENAAKIELGVPTDHQVPAILAETTSPSNLPAGIGMFIFGLGWNGFTLFHAIFMIGGMWMAFGPLALLLLAFYAIFFAAGFAMWAGAFQAAAEESIQLSGPVLTVTRTLGPIVRQNEHLLDPRSKATIGRFQKTSGDSESRATYGRAVILTDIEGKPVHLAVQTTDARRKDLRDKLNAYLEAQSIEVA